MRWKPSILMLALATFAAAANTGLAQDAQKCRLQKVVEWQVRSIGRHIAVDGAINGKKIGIVLDTGATRSMLVRASAKRLDIPIHEVRGARVRGVGGDSKVDVAIVDEFKLGEAVVGDMRFWVAGEQDHGEGFDLLLGTDFLRNFDVEFDLKDNAVRLWQPKDCAGASLAYWTSGVVGEAPIESQGGQIRLDVKLNGKPVAAILDSGASTSLVSGKAAAAAGSTTGPAAAPAVGVGGKAVEVRVGKFRSFAIGNEDVPDIDIAVLEQDLPMLIGADFLRSHRTLVSHSQRKMYFTYTGGPVFVTGSARAGTPPSDGGTAKTD